MTGENCDFALILSDAIFVTERHRLATIALQSNMPTVFGLREFPMAGGLASYGIDLRENWRRAAYSLIEYSRARSLPTCQSSSRPSMCCRDR